MKFNVSLGVIVFTLGFIGLVFCLVDNSGQIGNKVPLALFFMFIITIGIIIEMKMKQGGFDTFGEMDSNGGFA